MKFQGTTGGDISQAGEYLKEEGTYHFMITHVTDMPTIRGGNRKGELVANAAFEVTCSVCDGTTPNQRDKIFPVTFFHPDTSGTDEQQARAKKTYDRFWLATGMLTRAQVETQDLAYDIDLDKLVGRQLFIKVSKKSDGYLTAWSDFHHIDDPEMKGIPHDKNAIAMIPKDQRWIGSQAAKAPTQPARPAQPTQPSQPAQGLTQGEIAGL